jgi:hypothetical protein
MKKSFKKDITMIPNKFGDERRYEMFNNIAFKGTKLPKGVYYEDMDSTFLDFIDKDLEVVVDGKKVPVIMLSIQRWAEFSKNWEFSDDFKSVKIPFITVVRRPDIQPGTNYAGLWNIPKDRTYNYVQYTVWNGKRKGYDLYQIPQPTSVDITYDVRFFCNKMRDLNKFNKNVMKTFNSRQYYIYPNEHPMPVMLESNGDESVVDTLDSRRFYVQSFEMLLQGYLLDEDDFKVKPALDRMLLNYRADELVLDPTFKVSVNKQTKKVNYDVIFKPNSNPTFTIESEFDILFDSLSGLQNIMNIHFFVNNNPVTIPFTILAGQELKVTVTKNTNKTAFFNISGNLL